MPFISRALIAVYSKDIDRKRTAKWCLRDLLQNRCLEEKIDIDTAKKLNDTGVAYWVYVLGFKEIDGLNQFAGTYQSQAEIYNHIESRLDKFISDLPREVREEFERGIRYSFFSARGLV